MALWSLMLSGSGMLAEYCEGREWKTGNQGEWNRVHWKMACVVGKQVHSELQRIVGGLTCIVGASATVPKKHKLLHTKLGISTIPVATSSNRGRGHCCQYCASMWLLLASSHCWSQELACAWWGVVTLQPHPLQDPDRDTQDLQHFLPLVSGKDGNSSPSSISVAARCSSKQTT